MQYREVVTDYDTADAIVLSSHLHLECGTAGATDVLEDSLIYEKASQAVIVPDDVRSRHPKNSAQGMWESM